MKKVAVADIKGVAAYVLLSDFDGFLSHIEVFRPFGVYLCAWCERVVKFHSFPYSCPIFPLSFMEETVFSTGCFYLLYQRLVAQRANGPFLGSLFRSIALCVCFCASTMLSS